LAALDINFAHRLIGENMIMNKVNTNMIFMLLAFSIMGCSKNRDKRSLPIATSKATRAEVGNSDGSSQRYVIRMSDGKRDWEVEFPNTASGYMVKIPLKGEPGDNGILWESENLTEADKELLKELRRENPEMEREGVFKNGKNINDPEGRNEQGGFEPGAELDKDGKAINDPGKLGLQQNEDQAASTRPSYLLGIQEVGKLFKSKNYELAMVRIVQLEKAYPNDVKILSMKGTLWMKLGKKNLAREAWEQVLQIQPDNRAVIEALKQTH